MPKIQEHLEPDRLPKFTVKIKIVREITKGSYLRLAASKVSDARRQGVTSEMYKPILRREELSAGNAAGDILMVDQGLHSFNGA